MRLMNGTTNIRIDPKNVVRIEIKFDKYHPATGTWRKSGRARR